MRANSRNRYAVLIVVGVLIVLPTESSAQQPRTYPAIPVVLPDSAEVSLAMSAAPEALSRQATIYTVRDGRAIVLRLGVSRMSCLVSRDLHPESQYPMCFDEEASRTLLQVELLQNRCRSLGHREDEVTRRTEAAYASGELHTAERMAVVYMMSPRQVLFSSSGPEGRKAGSWWPHIMIAAPGVATAALGIPDGVGVSSFSVDGDNDSRKQFVVKVPYWSDGSRVAKP